MNRKECPHNHTQRLGTAHDFDPSHTVTCGHGCGYTERDLINELIAEIENLKKKLNQRNRSIKNLKKNQPDKTKICNTCFAVFKKGDSCKYCKDKDAKEKN